ncbi:unnamed protein product [Ambrosiozyma monospora]|uniref:Unnamed protein product n=1 Tax=Ambrosiozyma monospora TaxID=43982 RepID=A0A9W6WKY8_AMBMO|nr:unnamed protein product [Ambrosiozyma monospora]
MSPEPWEYEPALSGVRFKLPLGMDDESKSESKSKSKSESESDSKSKSDVKLVPTFLISYPIHNTLFGYATRHEIVQQSSLHPVYKVNLVESAKSNAFRVFQPGYECQLRFDVDFPCL